MKFLNIAGADVSADATASLSISSHLVALVPVTGVSDGFLRFLGPSLVAISLGPFGSCVGEVVSAASWHNFRKRQCNV